MWIFDRKTLEILEVNDAATETYGYSRTDFLKMTILDFRPSEDIPKVLQSTLGCAGKQAQRAGVETSKKRWHSLSG